MNAHALAVLEFPRVLALVAERATSALGADRVRALAPRRDREWLELEHARVGAVRALAGGDDPWAPEPTPDLTRQLARLRVAGAPWTGPELLAGATLLRSSRRTREALRDERRPAVATAVVAPLVGRLIAARDVEAEIERTLADDGTVRDDASPALRRIRRELRSAHGELIKILERVVARLEPHHQVPDMSVTVRNGRYVIPIRREARTAVGGIVHDASATGGTLFVEPPAAVEFGNRMRELEAEEAREVERILGELTDGLRPLRDELEASLDALVVLDALYARARYAAEFDCAPADLASAGEGFSIRAGRHPLLLAQGIAVVPFDLEMSADERTLLVSGPNTGGKTVLLKALGLVSAMVQSGIPAPVGAGSRVAVFADMFADIGDEQSIEASLSTFSAHLKNLAEILRLADRSSLVLIDELGSGTDPVEGAALGGAILEELTRRGTLTVATTHLGALKDLAAEGAGVVNASLQFDEAALAPTYRLVKGIPGRSYGLSIARRLRLPEGVVARAEERVPVSERRVTALLADLEQRETSLAEREREAAAVADEARRRMRDVAGRERAVRERERALERESRQEARRYLLEARAEIERAIAELRQSADASADDAARAARQAAERLADEQRTALERLDRADRRAAAGAPTSPDGRPDERIAVGSAVEVSTLGGRVGRVVELRDGSAVVAMGAMKLTVPTNGLRASARAELAPRAVAVVGDVPDVRAASEIDLRGMRVDEIEPIVMQALDAAVRADLRSVRIIHGKGTGALRDRVGEMLRKEPRVRGFRLGAWNEGGSGVTVVEL